MVVLGTVLLTGCYQRSTVNTPVGTETHQMFAAGLVSVNDIDTKTSFEKDCRQWLKPGLPADPVTNRPEDMQLPDRAIYATCFANHMQPVSPNGQRSAPIPMDVNGDGRADYFDYGGTYIPAHIYNAYGIPGLYPPGFVGGMGPMGMYNGSMQQFPGASISNVDGSANDPNMQVLATQTQQPGSSKSISSPWGNSEKPASEKDLAAVAEQTLVMQQQLDALKRERATKPTVTEGK